ncbi:MAG TPA: hypothetical protein EYH06_12175 [Chromatiales bacterium]|nr:hypothetical protein [Thiotrichales bacterium]HIP69320.1 hypothetical protein [Chromatiales bacterium]
MTMMNIKHKQQGAVLVVSLLILLVMTMLGLAAMQTSVLEEKMAGNALDKSMAFQAAEAGLRAGENRLKGSFSLIQLTNCEVGDDITLSPTVTVICYNLTTDPEPDPLAQATWDDAAAGVYTRVEANDYTQVGGQDFPKYYITALGRRPVGSLTNMAQGTGRPPSAGNIIDFRVTARGTGGSANAQSVLRSYFATLAP